MYIYQDCQLLKVKYEFPGLFRNPCANATCPPPPLRYVNIIFHNLFKIHRNTYNLARIPNSLIDRMIKL